MNMTKKQKAPKFKGTLLQKVKRIFCFVFCLFLRQKYFFFFENKMFFGQKTRKILTKKKPLMWTC